MPSELDQETRAIQNLVAQIDALDRWRDRVGRRVIAVFLAGFALALSLLVWMMIHGQQWSAPPTREHAAQR